jgi:hypothetical protein
MACARQRLASPRRGKLIRGLACVVGLALLLLAAEQHRHSGGVQGGTCVACAVHAWRAAPVDAQPRLTAPLLLLALVVVDLDDEAPPALPPPTPRSQGPPRA